MESPCTTPYEYTFLNLLLNITSFNYLFYLSRLLVRKSIYINHLLYFTPLDYYIYTIYDYSTFLLLSSLPLLSLLSLLSYFSYFFLFPQGTCSIDSFQGNIQCHQSYMHLHFLEYLPSLSIPIIPASIPTSVPASLPAFSHFLYYMAKFNI